MDTTNKHVGNVLRNMSDRDIKETMEQWAKKLNITGHNWELSMSRYITDILLCNHFDNDGNSVLVDEDITSDKYWDKQNE